MGDERSSIVSGLSFRSGLLLATLFLAQELGKVYDFDHQIGNGCVSSQLWFVVGARRCG
jgi:hypothetical protein